MILEACALVISFLLQLNLCALFDRPHEHPIKHPQEYCCAISAAKGTGYNYYCNNNATRQLTATHNIATTIAVYLIVCLALILLDIAQHVLLGLPNGTQLDKNAAVVTQHDVQKALQFFS